MKKPITLFVLLSCLYLTAQEKTKTDFNKNEFKINALFTVLGMPEVTYERILDEESGAGISVSGNLNDVTNKTSFMLSPYYRFYFGKKPAAGLFIEGFGSINTIQLSDYYDYDTNSYGNENYTNFGLGFGVGAKWITNRGVLFELNGGIGRNLTNADKNDTYDHTYIFRGGVTVGYRF